MKRILVLTGLILIATVGVRAQDVTNAPTHRRQSLTPERLAELAKEADAVWSQLPPEAKVRLLHLHRALTDMPPDERHFIHERIEQFLTMLPEERDRIKKNAERWREMSPEERELARKRFQQWRKDNPGENGFSPRWNGVPDATKTNHPPQETP